MEAFDEYDTKTKITILDEDFPGTIGFEETSLSVSKSKEFIELEIKRSDGSDGNISCIVRTLPTTGTTGL